MSVRIQPSPSIRFDKTWLAIDGFYDLVVKWWLENPLTEDLGISWKYKMQHLRKKLRGWSSNVRGEKKRVKSNLLSQIGYFEQHLEMDTLTDSDLSSWRSCQNELHQLYVEEEKY